MADDRQLRDLALVAAQLGAQAILRELRDDRIGVDTKAPDDFVTTADLAAEAAVLDAVRAARPDDAVLAEESGEHPGTTGVRWLVDPLDGTTNFVHGRRDYAVSVGVERDGEIVAGAVVRPRDGDWVAACDAEAVGRTSTPRVSSTCDLRASLVGVGLPSPRDQRRRVHAFLGDLTESIRDYRRGGSSACELFSVATGEQEGYLGFGVNLWDVAGGLAVVRAAGGRCHRVTTASGIEAFVAGTPDVADALARLVREV